MYDDFIRVDHVSRKIKRFDEKAHSCEIKTKQLVGADASCLFAVSVPDQLVTLRFVRQLELLQARWFIFFLLFPKIDIYSSSMTLSYRLYFYVFPVFFLNLLTKVFYNLEFLSWRSIFKLESILSWKILTLIYLQKVTIYLKFFMLK